jgi:hypothetical protein
MILDADVFNVNAVISAVWASRLFETKKHERNKRDSSSCFERISGQFKLALMGGGVLKHNLYISHFPDNLFSRSTGP